MSISMVLEKQVMAFTYNETRSSIKTNKGITLWDDHRAKLPFFSYYIKGTCFQPLSLLMVAFVAAYGDLCHLTEIVLDRVLHCNITPFSVFHTFSGKKLVRTGHIYGRTIKLYPP